MKVEGCPGFVRKGDTGIIVSTNKEGFEAYVQRRDNSRAQLKRQTSLEEEVKRLKELLHKTLGVI